MISRIITPMIIGGLGVAILISLGIWQVKRLEWKLAIIRQIDSRIHLEPVELPSKPMESHDNYISVWARGAITDDELLILTSRQGYGPGYRVVTAYELGNRRVLLDRGFIPENARYKSRSTGTTAVIGNLHWPDEVDRWFTPDPEGNLWFARDVPSMARVLDTEEVMIVAKNNSSRDTDLVSWPVSSKNISNNHLQYAITWFALAFIWMCMTLLWVRRLWQPASR